MTNYNSGGFTQNVNGIISDPSTLPQNFSDYQSWGWQQIEAAIFGGSELTGSGSQQAQGVSNPETLYQAAMSFEYVRLVLNLIAQSLSDQATGLTSGAWQGDAATSFLNTVTTFSQQVQANADVLTGGASGLWPVPQQLVNNATELSKAQATVLSIDSWYATQAANLNQNYNVYLGPMSNGLIPVSLISGLPNLMTQDMYGYALAPLVQNYSLTIESIVPPPNGVCLNVNPNGMTLNINFPNFNFPNSGFSNQGLPNSQGLPSFANVLGSSLNNIGKNLGLGSGLFNAAGLRLPPGSLLNGVGPLSRLAGLPAGVNPAMFSALNPGHVGGLTPGLGGG